MTKDISPLNQCDLCRKYLGVRNKYGRCTQCRTAAFAKEISYEHEPDPATMERILYYQQRAALGLPLFTESPWARQPGAHQRLLERQVKLAGTTGRVAPAYQVEETGLQVALFDVSFSTGGGRQ